jgi:hypothetical protein
VQSAQRLQVAKEKIQVARDKQVTSTIPKRWSLRRLGLGSVHPQ